MCCLLCAAYSHILVYSFVGLVQKAVNLLNSLLLERAPKDPAPPRRSRRSAADDDPKANQSLEVKVMARGMRKSDFPTVDDDILFREDSTDAADENIGRDIEKVKATVKQRKRVARNVGGWVSPEVSDKIDRSWLSGDEPPSQFDLSNYVPQVGDTVL